MDAEFTQPTRETDKKFLMSIDSSLNIPGRGTVCTGTIEQGSLKINQEVHLIGIKRQH